MFIECILFHLQNIQRPILATGMEDSGPAIQSIFPPVREDKYGSVRTSTPEGDTSKPESELVYKRLESVCVGSTTELEACKQELKTLREELEAKDLELQRLRKQNLDLAKKNEILERECNIEKDILQTIVELKVEVSPY